MDAAWTITELAEHAATALASGAPVQLNGRIRDLPNTRLIRWYTTIGLLDPPLGRRGRTALYGHRHLLQLVAVKRRQSEGRSIAEIQLELTGATDAQLSRIAALPTDVDAPKRPIAPPAHSDSPAHRKRTPSSSPKTQKQSPAAPPETASSTAPVSPETGEEATPSEGRPRFWAARPDVSFAPDVTVTRGGLTPDLGLPPDLRELPDERTAPTTVRPVQATPIQAIRLAPGITVTIDAPTTPLNDEDLAALQAAALPLLAELHRLGLADTPSAPAPAQSSSMTADPPGRSQ